MDAANDIREVMEKQGVEESVHYILKDHLGSWTTITDADGNVEQELSYDAWGSLRNPVGFGYGNVSHTFDRGYTLHEHYDDFDLINMNGRLYDPVIGRMFSPDIVIQDEHNLQAYNRYSYCFNNPLRFTDPSGYFVTIPPEFESFYLPQYFDDLATYKTELTKLGAENIDYSTNLLEGSPSTTVTEIWWSFEGDKYSMTIIEQDLKNYQQMLKCSCVASAVSAQEKRLNGNTLINEFSILWLFGWGLSDMIPQYHFKGLNTSCVLDYLKQVSTVYNDNKYFVPKKNNEHNEGFTFSEMKKDNGVLYRFYDDPKEMNNTISHTMNASRAIRFTMNNEILKHEIQVWDSGLVNGKVGGYRSFLEFAGGNLYYKMGILFKKQ